MARCEDCIHAKVCDNLISHGLPWNDGEYPAEKWCDLFKSTADVVPRAEVDKQIAKQKAMVLDVIDTFRNLLCIESYLDYEDTRPHYCVSIDDVNRIHAELKKKYTEPEPPKGDVS